VAKEQSEGRREKTLLHGNNMVVLRPIVHLHLSIWFGKMYGTSKDDNHKGRKLPTSQPFSERPRSESNLESRNFLM
jgi:hypothetical protein